MLEPVAFRSSTDFESSLRLVMLLCVGPLVVKSPFQKAILGSQTPFEGQGSLMLSVLIFRKLAPSALNTWLTPECEKTSSSKLQCAHKKFHFQKNVTVNMFVAEAGLMSL